MKKVSVSTPASTANLGAGFDCLGLALNLRNVVELWDVGRGAGLEIDIEGEGEERLPTDSSNLIARAAERVFVKVGKRPAGLLRMHAINGVPLSSGLGSSAATIVGGLVAANALVEGGLTREALLRLAYELEGHADNAAAALYGGLTLVSAAGSELMARPVPLSTAPAMRVVIVLPALRLSTAEARAALPAQVPMADAVYNVGHALFTVEALRSGDEALLRWAVGDRLHQPYRQKLIPGYAAVVAEAHKAGALAVALSGAGPSLVAFANSRHAEIAAAMQAAFQANGLASRTFILPVDRQGVQVSVVEG
jgi:homoserine kinase